MSKEKPKKAEEVKVPGRTRTQVAINTANIVDASDGQILPSLYQQIGTSLGLDSLQLGTITGVRSFLQAVTTPIWGWLSDKHSRKRVLAFGCWFWGIFTLLTGLAASYIDMIFWRAITGIGLAVIVPTTQSIIADYFPPSKRGKAFGILGFTGVLGTVFGTIFATAFVASGEPIFGIEGWRFVFVLWFVISMLVGLFVLVASKDPMRGKMEPELMKALTWQKAEKYKVKASDYKRILSNRTYIVILLQGIAGSIPWNAIFFMILWWEYMNFDPLTAGLMFAVAAFGAALGNILGGWVGDKAEKWRPNSGRIMIAQISVFAGIPMTFVIFLLIPPVQESFFLYILFAAITGLLTQWPSANNPVIFSEIFEPEIRSTVYSVDRVFEGSFMALGTVIAGWVAVIFGYVAPAPGQEISMMPAAMRATNMMALGYGMFFSAAIPWAICLFFYTLAYKTFPRDAERLRKSLEQRGKEMEKTK
nr:MFS transporter [Candidatus Njordarchaeum guaymaensis]